ncbi:hypothetical protein [Cytobacillus oceanisediminis]|uniref:hypothetical protein n=1 Tax=Cytobacillus oceanisediminis TaxID=665099 RepID=UPI00254BD9EF|nr:hypothetical protein [Cytobacillus oceanisediminis]MDK7669297.1 hypothetical protein [Cytobacillus oceanisediminis]
MARSIKATYIAEYGSFEQDVLLMAADLTLEVCEGEWTFRKVPEVSAEQDSVTVNLDECPVFSLAFSIDLDVDMEWLQGATLLQVIRMLIEATNKK